LASIVRSKPSQSEIALSEVLLLGVVPVNDLASFMQKDTNGIACWSERRQPGWSCPRSAHLLHSPRRV